MKKQGWMRTAAWTLAVGMLLTTGAPQAIYAAEPAGAEAATENPGDATEGVDDGTETEEATEEATTEEATTEDETTEDETTEEETTEATTEASYDADTDVTILDETTEADYDIGQDITVLPEGEIEEAEDTTAYEETAGEYNGYLFEASNGQATITGYKGNASRLKIPAYINGCKVTGIDQYAFYENKDIVSVEIPATVTWIGKYSSIDYGVFSGCENLETVTFATDSNLTYIGSYAFRGCESLKSITIPSQVQTICESAFEACKSLQNVTFKTTKLKRIDRLVFYGCISLQKISLPSTVEIIDDYAFKSCTKLTTIGFPKSLKTIGDEAFAFCAVTSITLPEGVTGIDSAAFYNCEKLKKVSLPSTIEEIEGGAFSGDGAFENCKNLTSVILKAGNKKAYIGSHAFEDCTSLEIIMIPKNYEFIGYRAFSGCTSLTTVHWADSGKVYANQSIDKDGVFMNCTSLRYLYLPKTVGSIESIGCSGMTVYGVKDSYVHKVCKENAIPFVAKYTTNYKRVTSVKLNKTSATITKGKSLTLKATVTPSNATNRAVTWVSSNSGIASVNSSGKVTARSTGTVTIYCKAKEGGPTIASCKIKVKSGTEAYVERIYTKALGRKAETAGLKYWTAEINAGRKTPVQVAEMFFFTPEFTNKKLNNTEYVKVLYRTFMGREYDRGGLNYWVGRLNRGESRKSVLRSFAGCPEFKNIVKSFGL